MHADDIYRLSLIDIAVFLAENWIALVGVPAAAALAAFMWLSSQPVHYTATASLQVPAEYLREEGAVSLDLRAFYRAVGEHDGVMVNLSAGSLAVTTRSNVAEEAIQSAIEAFASAREASLSPYLEEIAAAVNTIERLAPIIRQLERSPDDPAAILAIEKINAALVPVKDRLQDAASAMDALRSEPRVSVSSEASDPLSVAAFVAMTAEILLVVWLVFRAALRTAGETKLSLHKEYRYRPGEGGRRLP